MTGVKEMTLLPKDEPAAMVKSEPAPDIMTQLVRLAESPNFDVAKLERLIEMQERATARVSEEQFNASMSEAQTEMRPVAADQHNKQTNSDYASYAALDRALRPIYTKHGFGLSFDTGDAPSADLVRVLCYVTHRGGHKRTYKVDMPADGKGAKGGDVMTRTHATGAATQYGMRYLLKMIFNVAIGDDDDGNGATTKPPVMGMPDGFQDWWDDMKATADEGLPALKAAWEASPKGHRTYVTKVNLAAWESLKVSAANVGRAGK